MAESHGALSVMGLSPSPSEGWSGSGGSMVSVMGPVYYFGYGMKSVRASLGRLVHGPWSLRHRTLAHGPWSKCQRPSSLLNRQRSLVQGPWPSLQGQSAECQGPRSLIQHRKSESPDPNDPGKGPWHTVRTRESLGQLQRSRRRVETRSASFPRPRDQDAA